MPTARERAPPNRSRRRSPPVVRRSRWSARCTLATTMWEMDAPPQPRVAAMCSGRWDLLPKSDYSFAEGYTNLGYDEWLTIQNPTANTETVNVTVSNGVGTVYTFAEQVVGHSRSTVDMVAIVQQHVFHGGNGYPGYEISMAVQSSNGPFVVERPMYWNASGTQGGSDVIGYSGG